MSELPKTFDFAAIEAKWSQHWEESGAYRPERPDAEPYTIVNPPPNVTGSLHIGHALDNTLQDILIRHARMQGKDALWVVGTDHAGIATQMVVERQLEARQDKRTNYSREDFIKKVWEWKDESGGTITTQLRRLGCSMDWANERFTMDDGFTKAVTKVFVDLYNKGLIYRDKRLVNWDPKLKTAISDLEVETREMKGHFWHFRYPLADGVKLDNGADHIVVATTRPETMLADMAVAVNAEDPRYKSVIGKHVILPITGRRVPIIADDHADPELGSGAVKITPGHDFNDFEVGKRAGFKPAEMLNMFDADASVVQTRDGLIPKAFVEMDRFDARTAVISELKTLGLLVPHIVKNKDGEEEALDAEPRTIQTPYGDRGGVVIEPWLTDQWYVNAEELAKAPMAAVRSGAIDIVPKSWEKTFFNWMENIQPWCVSRQLWWGHRIPAWYAKDGEVFVAEDEGEAQALAGSGIALSRDEDVLDTWFSSALWPFGTLGWPEEKPSPLQGRGLGEGAGSGGTAHSAPSPNFSPEGERNSLLAHHYPNSVLVSGFDILFFWDARMAMMGMHFMEDVPWRTLYLHGLVRAADGSKMSKSKGNTVDPLILMDQYGADALRFFMAAMESQGRDIKMDQTRVEGYRNFGTKLWNAARFCQANDIGASRSIAAPPATLAVNRWIIGEVVETLDKLNKAFDEFRFDGMADAVYHFAWGTFCDWYLELIKPVLSKPSPLQGRGGSDEVAEGEGAGDIGTAPTAPSPNLSPEGEREQEETRAVAAWVFDQILVMLHPFMPFITEELWHAMGDRGDHMLIHAKWPAPDAVVDADASRNVAVSIGLVEEIRSIRAQYNLPWSETLRLQFAEQSSTLIAETRSIGSAFGRMTKTLRSQMFIHDRDEAEAQGIENVNQNMAKRDGMQFVFRGETLILELPDSVDLDAERARFAKAIEAASKEAASLAGRLNNPSFVEKAKPEAVEKARADHAEKVAEIERLTEALVRLG